MTDDTIIQYLTSGAAMLFFGLISIAFGVYAIRRTPQRLASRLLKNAPVQSGWKSAEHFQ